MIQQHRSIQPNGTILERAATVSELAAAVGRPRSTVARSLGNQLVTAAAESAPAHEADDLRAIIRHARIPRERAAEFWERVMRLASEFAQLPRSGETVYGFTAGLYPAEYPTLPAQAPGPEQDTGPAA